MATLQATSATAPARATAALRYPLVTFLVLTAALSWWPVLVKALYPAFPLYVFPFGPSLAALILAGAGGDGPKPRALLRRLILWRVAPRWYAVTLGIPMAGTLAAVYLNALLGAPEPTSSQLVRIAQQLPIFWLLQVVWALGEELGWRGYALPRLRAGRSALAAALVLSVFTTAWHLPNFLPGGLFVGWPFPSFVLFSVAACVLYVWLYDRTRGSLLVVVLGHAMGNAAYYSFFPLLSGADLLRWYWLISLLFAALVGVIALLSGMARTSAAPPEVVAKPAPEQ